MDKKEADDLKDKLFLNKKSGWETVTEEERNNIYTFSDEYMYYLNNSKTEKEIIESSRDILFKNGFNEIIQHQFFKNGANIINILNKSLIPSFKPNNEKLFENFDEIYTNLEINMNEIYENEKIQNLQKYESLFEIFIKK